MIDATEFARMTRPTADQPDFSEGGVRINAIAHEADLR
jgi:hypothetical protein